MNDDIKLLPCPFCGGSAHLSRADETVNVRCDGWNPGECLGAGPNCYTEAEAAAGWNRRAAVEADRDNHFAHVRKMVPSDEELDDLSDEFHGYSGNHTRDGYLIPKFDYLGFARALLSRYGSSQPAASAEVDAWRERFPAYEYRPQDECVSLKLSTPAASAEPRPDEYVYFADWYGKGAPDESEVEPHDMARHAWLAGIRFADLFPLAAPVAQEPGISADLDDRLTQALEERDTAEGWADGLAAQIGKYFGQDIGEHSNLNNPWQEAKEIIEDAEPYAPVVQEPVGCIVSSPVFGNADRKIAVLEVDLPVDTPLYTAPVAAQAQPVPDVLFDGYAVLSALDDKARSRTSPENVSDVLDAVVRLMRAIPQTVAQAQLSGNSGELASAQDREDAEHILALKDAECNAASDSYFSARPSLPETIETRILFEDGFDRGYDAAAHIAEQMGIEGTK